MTMIQQNNKLTSDEIRSRKVYFDVVLYPKDRDMSRRWIIKYKAPDFNTGKLKEYKYTGLMNLVTDKEKRQQLADDYIMKFNRGEHPPLYKGARCLPPEGHSLNFADMLGACLVYVKSKKNEVTETTYGHYLGQVNEFGRWLEKSGLQNNAIGSFGKDNARDYLNYLTGKKLSNKTRNEHKRLLGCIWQDLIDDDKMQSNPWKKIKRLKNETNSHLSYPPSLRKTISLKLPGYDKQLYMLVMLEYYCAIRPHQEARLLQVKYLNNIMGTITVPRHLIKGGKKDKTRIIPNQLYKLLNDYGYFDANPEHYLFTLQHAPGDKPVSKNYFKNRWAAFRKDFEIPAQYQLYGAKHTAGEEMAAHFSPFEIKEQMGHDSILSQQSYTKGFDYTKMQSLRGKYPDFI
jgi:integrase